MSPVWSEAAGQPETGGTVTLVDETAFCISDHAGDIDGVSHGLIDRDSRFVSRWTLHVDGRSPTPLECHATGPDAATFVLTGAPREHRADTDLVVVRRRVLADGLTEQIQLRNHGELPRHCAVELLVAADFADLFEVKEGRPALRATRRRADDRTITLDYEGPGFRRTTVVAFEAGAHVTEDAARWAVELAPGATWTTVVRVETRFDAEHRPHPHGPPPAPGPAVPVPGMRLRGDSETLERLVNRSWRDLDALRIHDERTGADVVAAGAPWFMTLFGRDALIAAWMTLPFDPTLAVGTLRTLAALQGTRDDPDTEEEPGRILHEIRVGETARRALAGHDVYYGSVDATPLFAMVVAEAARWGVATDAIDELLPAVDRALAWVTGPGDRDGDGYVEYERRSRHGLEHQGWKDSWDGIRFADGTVARAPIALSEVQAYAFAAWQGRAELAEARGDDARAEECRRRATALRRRFNADFRSPGGRGFAIGLDAVKRPIDGVASNVGHCLWCGIVDDPGTDAAVAQLTGPALASGWGLRTLATGTVGYNPVGYHTGSVWPHDTAIAVAGLARAGRIDDASRLARALVEASEHFDGRLPELFAGFDRDDVTFPVRYPTSCSPQAWAAGAGLLVLRSLLRLDADVPRGLIRHATTVPSWLGDFTLDGLVVAGRTARLEVRDGHVALHDLPPGLRVVERGGVAP